MPSLADVIQRVRNKLTDHSDWLYLGRSADRLILQTEADLGCPDFDEASDEEIDPVGFMERGLQSTIDIQTVEECIRWADQLAECASDEAALDVIRYYIRFDAWPQTLNSPDPPPDDEVLRRLDLGVL